MTDHKFNLNELGSQTSNVLPEGAQPLTPDALRQLKAQGIDVPNEVMEQASVIEKPSEENTTEEEFTESDTKNAEPTEKEILEFYDNVIMQEVPFTRTFHIVHPITGDKTPVVLRTRSSAEAATILKKVMEHSDERGLEAVRTMNDLNLSYSLCSIGDRNYDVGTVEERVAILDKMPAPKKNILWEFQAYFDTLVDNIRVKHVNF